MDDDEPGAERSAELERAYEANVEADRPPYYGVHIRSLGELEWIIGVRGWSTPGTEYTHREATADLRGAFLEQVNLSGANLGNADLREAHLRLSNLTGMSLRVAKLRGAELANSGLPGADLKFADLRDAHLAGADLESADLERCKLDEAVLYVANLSQARLIDASLRKTTLTHADLRGADLTFAAMDSETALAATKFDERTRFRDTRWGDASLTQIDWDQVPRVGDEADIEVATDDPSRAQACRKAARAYRGLYVALRSQGLSGPASRYRWRERVLERKALWYSHKWAAWLLSGILNVTCGYGERPRRAFATYGAAISVWTVVFLAITHWLTTSTTELSLWEALILSLTSFHGRGFLPSTYTLGDPTAIAAGAEAVVGLFIEALLVATFARRLFED